MRGARSEGNESARAIKGRRIGAGYLRHARQTRCAGVAVSRHSKERVMLTGIPCTVMRGGTSKGLYFSAQDLPSDRIVRDRVLLAAMGSPDERQIDGMGGAHPLTSKVAVLSRSSRPDADIDYLFL